MMWYLSFSAKLFLFIPVLLAFYPHDCHLIVVRWLTELQPCLFSLWLEEGGRDSVSKPSSYALSPLPASKILPRNSPPDSHLYPSGHRSHSTLGPILDKALVEENRIQVTGAISLSTGAGLGVSLPRDEEISAYFLKKSSSVIQEEEGRECLLGR